MVFCALVVYLWVLYSQKVLKAVTEEAAVRMVSSVIATQKNGVPKADRIPDMSEEALMGSA